MIGAGSLALTLAASAQAQSAPTPTSPVAAPAPVTGAGVNLNLTPRRVTLDRVNRLATVYVFNQGTAAASFDVALVDRVMLPDGQIRALDQAAASGDSKAIADRLHSAHDLVVAAPRRITLAPNKGQTLRLRAAPPPPADGTPGEYRTHLTVTNIPPPDTGLTADQAVAQQSGQLVLRVRSVVALSIPVIVRTAPIDARARIENVRANETETRLSPDAAPTKVAALAFDIARLGASSVFGNIEIRAGAKNAETLGLARGVAVYPEIEKRSLQVILKRKPKPGEKLTILFIDDDGRPGTELARTSFEAP